MKRLMQRYPRITVYRAKDGWRWRMVAGGRCVAESGEAYSERNKCVWAMSSVFELLHEDVIGSHVNGAPTSREGWAPVRVRIEGLPR